MGSKIHEGPSLTFNLNLYLIYFLFKNLLDANNTFVPQSAVHVRHIEER
jgi:hypothetical protein